MKTLAHEIILASAGSGKTYQLTNRFIRLLALGVTPDRIVALTFTRKAAGEFLDAILEKLAGAAGDPAIAETLASEIGAGSRSQDDFLVMLRSMVQNTHRLSLTTLDSFFLRIAQGMPFELGLGGNVRILGAGGRVEAARHDVYDAVFHQLHEQPETRAAFLFALKESAYGDRDLRILPQIDRFVAEHHGTVIRIPDGRYWGDPASIWVDGSPLIGLTISDFHSALDRLETAFSHIDLTAKAEQTLAKFFPQARAWRFGETPPSPMDTVMKNLLEHAADLAQGNAKLPVGGKKLEFSGPLADAAWAAVSAFAGIEITAKINRTRALYAVLLSYERSHDSMLRRRGYLAFDDLTVVLQRELAEHDGVAADLAYRLDGKYDHWLLDEFQDTSRRQWDVVRPLVDEIVRDPSGDRSYFQVGDVKQSIYAWRGGDPTLISDIREQYDGMFEERQLARSFRSVPAVLDCVNRVFGDTSGLSEFVPAAAVERMEWATHEPSEMTAGGSGFACFSQTEDPKGKQEEVYGRALELVREVRPLDRNLSCAVLCEGNKAVNAIVDYFRAEGFAAVVSGSKVKPATDNPVTVALLALIRMAAFPGDRLAQGIVEASPLAGVIEEAEMSVSEAAVHTLAQVGREGFASTVEDWTSRLPDPGPFARHRLSGLTEIARIYDAEPERSVAGFLDFAESYETEEAPGSGVVQVMTIHASKGLGFDMVILAELEGKSLLEIRGGLAVGGTPAAPDWVLDMPKKNVAAIDPVLAAHSKKQEEDAGFEALCKWYVAMTRAKRGLYLVSRARGGAAKNILQVFDGILGAGYQNGDPAWFEEFEVVAADGGETFAAPPESIDLGPGKRLAPVVGSSAQTRSSSAARARGNAVHAELAEIEWQPADSALHPAFIRPGGEVTLWREKGLDCQLDGRWVSVVFDRVVIEHDTKKAMVYDFKTGSAAGAEKQMDLYRRVLEQMLIGYEVATQVVLLPRQ